MTFTEMTNADGNSKGNSTSVSAVNSNITIKSKEKRMPEHKPRLGAPPDGGWGWVVVLSSFSISLLVDGVCFSFGIFFDDFRTEFRSNKATTSWIGSVLNGSYLIFGPLVSALVNIYGCRRVAMSGAILSSVAFFCSSYTHSIGTLIFTFGFLGGIGFGLMYLPAIVIVGYYFERRRALATGLACCGSGIGAFLFAPFTEYLLNEYGWRGSTWIISGLVLNGFMFALFYRPLPGPIIEEVVSITSSPNSQSDSLVVEKEGQKSSSQAIVSHPDRSPEGDIERVPMSAQMPQKPVMKVVESKLLDVEHSAGGVYRTRSVTLSGPGKVNEEDSSFRTDILRLTRSQDLSPPKRNANNTMVTRNSPKQQLRVELPHLQRKDIFYSGSLWHLKEFKELGSLEEFRREMISTNPSANSTTGQQMSTSSNGANTTTGLASATVTVSKPSMKEAITSIFDVHLLKSPTFLIYGLACFLCMAGFFVPFIYMPGHAIELGVDTQSAAFLISIIGITNTVGRVAVGFISDQPWADCLFINNVALLVGGGVTVFVPFFNHYYVLAIYAVIFGSSIAVFVSLRSIIMVELMGLEKLTTAFGFVIMFQGFSSLLGPPIAGALSDSTGNYNAAFYMSGLTLFLSGAICIPLRRVAHWENRRAAAKAKTNARLANDASPPLSRREGDEKEQFEGAHSNGDNSISISNNNNNNNTNKGKDDGNRKNGGARNYVSKPSTKNHDVATPEETIPMISASSKN